MSVPKRSQTFPERMATHPFPAFPSVPPLKGGGNVGNGKRGNGAGCHRARLSRSELLHLVHYLRIMRCTPHLSNWERTFCASMVEQSERSLWSPTERQAATMQRIVAAFKRAPLGDGEGVIE
jgi:hypothetical protein